ncbi:MAG TPA: hypothetical protein VHL11_22595 [Phototrophicaceae bacterium]|jgi:hypothetical protein|nr:hypothetical protein [Phototrophicaceae bacterium]
MGRKQRAKVKQNPTSAKPGKAAASTSAGSVSSASRVVDQENDSESTLDSTLVSILRLPRVVRMVIIALPALAATIIFTPVVDSIYLQFFYTPETKIAPSLITSVVALLVYAIGWVLVVGTAGEKPQERQAIKWYALASIFLIVFAAIWFGYLLIDSMRGG